MECAFDVLQSKFAIMCGVARMQDKRILHDKMTTCIIVHNMIIEGECDVNPQIEDSMEVPTSEVEMVVD